MRSNVTLGKVNLETEWRNGSGIFGLCETEWHLRNGVASSMTEAPGRFEELERADCGASASIRSGSCGSYGSRSIANRIPISTRRDL